MTSGQTIWLLAIGLALLAGWTDWRSRKIPNWLTVPGLVAGIALNSYVNGWEGAKSSLEGAGLALVVLLPVVILRGLGAGDWKLMGAVGAFLGPGLFLVVLTVSVLVAGVMAIVQMIRARRVVRTLRNLVVLVHGFIIFGLRPNPNVSLDDPDSLKLPFGIAAAIGTLLCGCAALWHGRL
ncbi:MAG: A24 family peptidase [Candidatus Acidiferrales bacterium]